jgi:hypothetical protein
VEPAFKALAFLLFVYNNNIKDYLKKFKNLEKKFLQNILQEMFLYAVC